MQVCIMICTQFVIPNSYIHLYVYINHLYIYTLERVGIPVGQSKSAKGSRNSHEESVGSEDDETDQRGKRRGERECTSDVVVCSDHVSMSFSACSSGLTSGSPKHPVSLLSTIYYIYIYLIHLISFTHIQVKRRERCEIRAAKERWT